MAARLDLLQGSPDAPLALLAALAIALLAVTLLALRGIVNRLFGPEPETATYRLVETNQHLALADADDVDGKRLVGFEGEDIEEFLRRAEDRNEIRLHFVLDREGRRTPWEDWRADPDRRPPAGVILEDSKGLVRVHDSGRVEAKPPLDAGVRDDLLEVVAEVLETDRDRGREPPSAIG